MREDKKNMLKTSSMVYKTLVVGVIVLFIGVGIQPTFAITKDFINHPPYEPSNPIPPDGAENWTGGGLLWTGGDPDGDLVYCDVYFGNTTPPPEVLHHGTATKYIIPGSFEFNKIYYWKIVSTDEHGASTEGPIWSFTLGESYSEHILNVGGTGEGNYSSIQDAIDNASDGDTVFVFDDSSPYYENIIIYKSINLIGENKESTIIVDNYSHSSSAVTIKWINVTITCFTIIGEATYNGIEINFDYSKIFNNNIIAKEPINIKSSFNSIIKNYLEGGKYTSISMGSSDSFNDIIDNTITGGDDGIYLIDCNDNNIINNRIKCEVSGIRLSESNENTISNNTMDKGGLCLQNSYNNIISDNYVNDKPILYLHNESNKVFNQDFGQIIVIDCNNITIENQVLNDLNTGVYLFKSKNCKIQNNSISHKTPFSGYGIKVVSCENTILFNNTLSYLDGIDIYFSNNTSISYNNILNCRIGISLAYCNNSKIFKNNLVNNSQSIDFYIGSRNSIVTMNNFYRRRWFFALFNDPINANNIWYRNYWGRPRILPKMIIGNLILDDEYPFYKSRFYIKFDWHPALRLYDIKV